MARSGWKRLSYMRVVFGSPGPDVSMQTLISDAIKNLPNRHQRECDDPTFGVVVLRHSRRGGDKSSALFFDVAACAPGVGASAMSIGPAKVSESDSPVNPPENRAFKRAEGFALVHGDDIIICVDHMRIATVERYLRKLISKARNNQAVSFELVPVQDVDKREVLSDEGVKTLRVKSAMSAASQVLEQSGSPRAWFRRQLANLQDLLTDDLGSNKDRQVLADKWAKINVDTIISVKGGTRGEEIALKALQAAGAEALEEADDGVELTITTRQGTKIRGRDLVLGKSVLLDRGERSDDLDRIKVWDELELYEMELRGQQRWGQ